MNPVQRSDGWTEVILSPKKKPDNPSDILRGKIKLTFKNNAFADCRVVVMHGLSQTRIEIWDKDMRNALIPPDKRSTFDNIYDDFFKWLRDMAPESQKETIVSIKVVFRSFGAGLSSAATYVGTTIMTSIVSLNLFARNGGQ